MLRRIAFSTVVLLLAACGGGDTLDLQGVWSGTYFADGASNPPVTLKAIIGSAGPTLLFDGSGYVYAMSQRAGSNLAATLTVYPPYGFIFTGGKRTLSATMAGSATTNSMTGQLQIDGATAQFSMKSATPYTGTPSVVAGSWQGVDLGSNGVALTVAADGTAIGFDSFGCQLGGHITPVSGGANLFTVTLHSKSGGVLCGLDLDGLAYESDTDEFDRFGHGAGTYYVMVVYNVNEAMVTEFRVQ
jgi:hypothetical protein